MENVLTQETIRAIDEIYNRMPNRWEKWKRYPEDKERDMVDLTDTLSQGFYPQD